MCSISSTVSCCNAIFQELSFGTVFTPNLAASLEKPNASCIVNGENTENDAETFSDKLSERIPLMKVIRSSRASRAVACYVVEM